MENKEYLGDSVYIEYDEYTDTIILTTENGTPSDPSNTVYLEHNVIKNLLKYIQEKRHATIK